MTGSSAAPFLELLIVRATPRLAGPEHATRLSARDADAAHRSVACPTLTAFPLPSPSHRRLMRSLFGPLSLHANDAPQTLASSEGEQRATSDHSEPAAYRMVQGRCRRSALGHAMRAAIANAQSEVLARVSPRARLRATGVEMMTGCALRHRKSYISGIGALRGLVCI